MSKSLSSSNVLRFSVQNYHPGGSDPTGDITVEVYNASDVGHGSVLLSSYLPESMKVNKWYDVEIPLQDLGSPSNVRGIAFWSEDDLVLAWDCIEIDYDPDYSPANAYTDALGTGWVNWSWNTAVNLQSSYAYSGQYGLTAGTTAPWGGLHLHINELDTGAYETLRFAVRGYGNGGQELYVALVDDNGQMINPPVYVSDYVAGNYLSPHEWDYVVIPLTDLHAENRDIEGIVFQLPNIDNYRLDEIAFSTSSGTSYSVNTPVPASSVLFHDSIGTGWYAWDYNVTYNGDVPLHFDGDEGLELAFQGAWSPFQFCPNETFDTSGYNTLTFAIHGGKQGGQDVFVWIYNANHQRTGVYAEVKDYVVGGVLSPYVWHEVRIPLSALNAEGIGITAVEFESGDAFTVTIDEVRFDSFTDNNTGVCNEE